MNIFEDAIKNKKGIYLPNYIKNPPNDWKEFIYAIHNGYASYTPEWSPEAMAEFMKGGRVKRGELQIWGYMTIFVENPQFEEITGWKEMWDQAVKDFDGRLPQTSFALVNWSSHENLTNKHDDVTHNLYFQCIGSVEWRVYDENDNYESFELKPGDAILVPATVYHQVFAHEPRTAMTIGFPNVENITSNK